jgi:rRNA maturation RNase YbeY
LRAAVRQTAVVDCAQCGLGCHRSITLHNRQRRRSVNLRLLRRIAGALLQGAWPDGPLELAIYIVAEPEMTRLNEAFLHHQGSTDVITFDYAEPATPPARRPRSPALLYGEIFVCLDEAVSQARRFRTTWQSELVRYVVHGVLHLLGHDDRDSRSRRKMKVAEDSLLNGLARQFGFSRLGPKG